MTSRLEDLESAKATLSQRKPIDDEDAKRIKARLATVNDEIVKEGGKVERTEKVETATRAAAPEKAVTRTSKKG